MATQKTMTHFRVVLIATLCVIVFTWPLLLSPNGLIISRQFDIYTFAWMVHTAPSLEAFHTDLSNWPIGQTMQRSDSLLMLLIAFFLHGILDPWLVVSIIGVGGLIASIWAAEQFARVVWEIDAPHSYICGICFGLSGIGIVTLLEGPWYLLCVPWIPLVGTYTWLFLQNPIRRHIVLLVLFWFLSLLTSAYVGIASSILLLWMSFWELWKNKELRSKKKVYSWIKVYGSISFLGTSYLLFFFFQNRSKRAFDGANTQREQVVDYASLNLQNSIFWSPEIDLVFHSSAPIIGVLAIATLAFSPLLLSGREWKRWWGLGIFSLLLSFGHFIGLVAHEWQIPWILYPLRNTSIGSFIHFPLRFFWVGSLCCGLLLAKCSQRACHTRKTHFWIIIAMVCMEAFLINGTIFRTAKTPVYTPEIYSQTTPNRAIFEVYPNISNQFGIEPLYIKNTLCAYQIDHKRPILLSCMGTTVNSGTDWVLRNKFFNDVLNKQEIDWKNTLPKLGIGSLVLHAELFQSTEQSIILKYLYTTFGDPTATHTHGEYLLLWNLSESSETNYRQSYLDFTNDYKASPHYSN